MVSQKEFCYPIGKIRLDIDQLPATFLPQPQQRFGSSSHINTDNLSCKLLLHQHLYSHEICVTDIRNGQVKAVQLWY
jgi:hypothetical protein